MSDDLAPSHSSGMAADIGLNSSARTPFRYTMHSKAISLANRLRAVVDTLFQQPQSIADSSRASAIESELSLNADADTRYAHPPHPAFEKNLTVFTQEWVGIRAAAGSFPGHKLAISKDAQIGPAQLQRLQTLLKELKIETIVFHGSSNGLLRAAEAFRSIDPSLRICCVWHGALAAWCFDEERAFAATMFSMANDGVFDRISIMKRGAHVLHPKAVPYLLPNLPPVVSFRPLKNQEQKDKKRTVMFAAWNNVWKNMYANVGAAAHSSQVDKIITYSPVDPKLFNTDRIQSVDYQSREQHLARLATIDLVLNVTTVDCHPMVEAEALSVGTPCLRSDLDLDFGRGHIFEQLMTVPNPHNLVSIAETIDKVFAVPAEELRAIVEDYKNLVIETSLNRYSQFLEF